MRTPRGKSDHSSKGAAESNGRRVVARKGAAKRNNSRHLNELIEKVPFASWNEFKTRLFGELFGKGPVIRGRYLFRGQRDATWTLAPSFDRSFRGVEGKERDRLESALLEHFSEECKQDPETAHLLGDQDRLHAYAQHSGVPTRLLDWTESPYIASFFAFQHAVSAFQSTIDNLELEQSVALWALDRNHYVWNRGRGVEIFSPSICDNSRMQRQAGHFTRSRTPFRSLQEYVKHFGEQGRGALKLFLIPNKEAMPAIADLDLMGIHNSALFPDQGGRAKASIVRTVLGVQSRG